VCSERVESVIEVRIIDGDARDRRLGENQTGGKQEKGILFVLMRVLLSPRMAAWGSQY